MLRAGLSVPAQICIAVFATLAGVVAVVAGAWVFLSQRRRRAQPSGAVLFAGGHEGKNGVRRAASLTSCWPCRQPALPSNTVQNVDSA